MSEFGSPPIDAAPIVETEPATPNSPTDDSVDEFWTRAQHALWRVLVLDADTGSHPFGSSNITGLSIAYKESRGHSTGSFALVVLVKVKAPRSSLSRETAIPPYFRFEGHSFPTDVVETGENRFTLSVNSGTMANASGVGPSTLGCLVKITGSLKTYALGCAHSLSNFGKVALGTAIYDPATIYANKQKVGILHARSSFKARAPKGQPAVYNKTDGALVELTGPGTVSPYINNIGSLKNPSITAVIDMTVIAAGGKSNVKVTGAVESLATIVTALDLEGHVFDFYPCIKVKLLSPLNKTEFSDQGDSGMILLASPSLRPVGVVFSSAGQKGFAIPITPVIDQFKISSFVQHP